MKTRTDELFVYDILECCEKIEQYLTGVTKENFFENPMLQDAVVRNIEIIGEASKSLSSEFRERSPEVEWRDIIRMRDKMVHHYFKLDLDVVWQTATQDVPQLATHIRNVDASN